MSTKAAKRAEEKKRKDLTVKCPFYPILVLVFVFVRQIDKDKHTATHKQVLRRRRRTWSSPCAHSYVDFSPGQGKAGNSTRARVFRRSVVGPFVGTMSI